ECLSARDPYCGWDKKQKRCTTIEDSSNMSLWSQNITECPVKNLMVHGQLGTWSPWQPCEHTDGDSTGSCMCRSRMCNNPQPRCGGRDCDGARIEIANCSRLSSLNLNPIKLAYVRSKLCCFNHSKRMELGPHGRPGPPAALPVGLAFRSVRGHAATLLRDTEAGSVSDKAERSDSAMKTVHAHYQSSGLRGALGINVVQTVVEACTPGRGPVKMETLEYKTCSPEACPEVRRSTPWTPWTPTNITQSGARQEQRFRYTCRAQLADPHDLQFGRKKTESRFCPNDGSAVCDTDSLVDDLLKSGKTSVRIINGGWSFWGGWSSCTRDCELGFRTRKRMCTNPEPKNGGVPCIGSAMEYQDCNSHPCPVKGSWSCWTPWSQCSATCGGGHYQRTRTCTNPAPTNGEDICIGLHTEEALCNTHPCEGGWSEWSEWSLCNEDSIQHRSRFCEIHSPGSVQCAGNSTQYQECLYNEIPVILPASSIDESVNCGGFSLIHLIATGLSCFFGSSLLTFVIYIYCQRCQRQSQESTVIHPTTPNHLHYKGNTTPKNEKYTPMEFKAPNCTGKVYHCRQTNGKETVSSTEYIISWMHA
ncbi:hypothetical protein Chor_016053, partial [Crotalus horridus]